jgi:hypothetical protein
VKQIPQQPYLQWKIKNKVSYDTEAHVKVHVTKVRADMMQRNDTVGVNFVSTILTPTALILANSYRNKP